MNFWHIQMHLPFAHDDEEARIDPMDLLNESPSLIATNGEDKVTEFQKMQIDDVVLVREGSTPLALCRVSGEVFSNQALIDKYRYYNYREVRVLGFYKGSNSFPHHRPTIERLVNPNTASWKFIETWYTEILKKRDDWHD